MSDHDTLCSTRDNPTPSAEEVSVHYWTEREKEVSDQYAALLNECIDKLKQLDKETNYYPIIQLDENRRIGRFDSESFRRGWCITPRKWSELCLAKVEVELKEYQELAKRYSAQIIELQQIIARQK